MSKQNVHFCHVRVNRNNRETARHKDYTFAFRFVDNAVQVGFAFCTLGGRDVKPDNFCRATGRDVATEQMLKCANTTQTVGTVSARFATLTFDRISAVNAIPTPKEVRAYVTSNVFEIAGTR